MKNFSSIITTWYSANKRDLPWRNTTNPYLIWISEIMLQQTRVNQCIHYFERFISNFPTIQELAAAPEQEVLQNWEGLGYYSRARNIHFSAKYIVNELDGNFPTNYQELLKLKGIGIYTAAAIASFSFKEKVAVVDGNVFRVLARVFALEDDISAPKTQQKFKLLAEQLMPNWGHEIFNQAIMEFGALQCVPQNPNCEICPFVGTCEAFALKTVKELPVKTKKVKVTERAFDYKILIHENNFYLRKRIGKDIWTGLYEFYNQATIEDVLEEENLVQIIDKETIKHQLTHQSLTLNFITYRLKKSLIIPNFEMVNVSELNNFPLPIVLRNYLNSIIDKVIHG